MVHECVSRNDPEDSAPSLGVLCIQFVWASRQLYVQVQPKRLCANDMQRHDGMLPITDTGLIRKLELTGTERLPKFGQFSFYREFGSKLVLQSLHPDPIYRFTCDSESFVFTQSAPGRLRAHLDKVMRSHAATLDSVRIGARMMRTWNDDPRTLAVRITPFAVP